VAVRNPTQWQAPSGTGYFSLSGGLNFATIAGAQLTTLAGTLLVTDADVYIPKYQVSWTLTGRNTTQWEAGYVTTVGTEDFADNLGNLITDNSGNNIVTTPTYAKSKNATAWTATGV
jgi:hypothetical protein